MSKTYRIILDLNEQQMAAFEQVLMNMPYGHVAQIVESVKTQLKSHATPDFNSGTVEVPA